jgi:GrpB-like predicted nucleotidyltransferase (UPF0157 family)
MSSPTGDIGSHPISDEDLGRILIGPVTPHNGPITLAEYDPSWPSLFAREAG